MKRLALLSFLGALSSPAVLACGGCASTSSAEAPAAATAATSTATLRIEGMTCASCTVTIRTAANKLDGVGTIDVDVEAGRATVTFDAEKVSAEQIAAKITDAGYAATVQPAEGA
jgi:mercuric ion binding protein